MKSGDLPIEKAFEPNEGAYQPLVDKNMPPFTDENSSKKITFAENISSAEKPSSQLSSSYKDILSQPPTELSHCHKLQWLQRRRTAGLWAQCDECDCWRYLSNVLDRHELPKKWYCSMNPDPAYAKCSVPEAPLPLRDEEDLIHSEYSTGSLVWARLTGWPWWPAMVDDCPDTEQFYWLDGFSDIPTHYNVVFFDNVEATRAWISPENLRPYASNKTTFKHLLKNKKFHARLRGAMSQADLAVEMELAKRLENYSFISRHKGTINTPKKVNKHDLQKYQRRFRKKFNVEFPIETSDSDGERNLDEARSKKNSNVILLGTPKRPRNDKTQKSTFQMLAKHKNANLPTVLEKEQSQAVDEFLRSNDNTNTERPPNSMVPQVGSTEATAFDNDTSTTYFPGSEIPDTTLGRETPNSDDFDF